MLLPDLPPDIEFPPLTKSDDDFTFSFRVKRAALGPYIAEHWGWDEDFQKRMHAERFRQKPLFGIDCSSQRIGTLSLMLVDEHLRFGEFYLWPDQQRKGIGSRVLRHCISLADQAGRSLRLEYLKWNPVGSLYERYGFKVIGDSDIHWYMERKP
ncbi:MAG TPA: GNAT family N-acetyltransferase [Dongiaceae bacterium]|nr:GNAT family N-acetyltransferase [Dongiaceae bacterium]